MLLYRTSQGPVVENGGQFYVVESDWNDLVNDSELHRTLLSILAASNPSAAASELVLGTLAPVVDQELWAAGVTYFRSRTARMDESHDAGGGDFYDRVYTAERPELFLKATPGRVVGHRQAMHMRRDSHWIVPEPELTLVVTRDAKIIGYTIGNDLSCRDLEGENPLYLPQAKTFDRCAALGPAILVSPSPLPPETAIQLRVTRRGNLVVEDRTTLSQMKRTPTELVEFLFRDNAHPHGCLLMTGTGVVPPDDFSLEIGDVVDISIDGIGTLSNAID